MNTYYKEMQLSITEAENQGLLVPTLRSTTFPKLNSEFFEPEGGDWIQSPIYTEKTQEWYQKVYSGARTMNYAKKPLTVP